MGEMTTDEWLPLLEGDDLEDALYGPERVAPPIRANGLAICPLGIAGSAEIGVIELEAAVREYGATCPPTAWAMQAFQAIAYERRNLTEKAIKRERDKHGD